MIKCWAGNFKPRYKKVNGKDVQTGWRALTKKEMTEDDAEVAEWNAKNPDNPIPPCECEVCRTRRMFNDPNFDQRSLPSGVQRGIARYDKYGKGQTLGGSVVARADAGRGLALASGEKGNAAAGEAGGGEVEVDEYADVKRGGGTRLSTSNVLTAIKTVSRGCRGQCWCI
jgi:hypothetical protein